VVVEGADGSHQAAAVQQRDRCGLRGDERKPAGAADEQRVRAEVLTGLQQALAGQLLPAHAAAVPIPWNQMDDELARKQDDGKVAGVA
jgi:hypothetical protein